MVAQIDEQRIGMFTFTVNPSRQFDGFANVRFASGEVCGWGGAASGALTLG